MEKTNLFQDAVADAKLIRKLAIETAKSNLAETFTPKIKSMLATKLQEEEDIELDETVEETTEEAQTAAPVVAEEETTMDEVNLDELLAELEAEEDTTDEAPLEEEESDEVDLDELLEGEDEEEGEEEEEEQKVEDMSVEELTSLIKDIVKSEMGGETEDVPAEEEVEVETELDEAKKKAAGKGKTHPYTELAEAKKAIDYLRNELNETNLLNAKLLYANKIFKSKSLTESEKMKVINAFDKAKNVKETKLVYEALVSNFAKPAKKTSLKESIGFASKPTGPVKKKEELTSIFDSATVNRLQQLAGLKPLY